MTEFYVDGNGNYLGGFDGATPPENSIEITSPPKHGLDIWINGGWVEPPKSDEKLKLEGVLIFGEMCSATKEDMWGLNAIKDWVLAGNDTNYEFENGAIVTLTVANWDSFEDLWVPFRASFF